MPIKVLLSFPSAVAGAKVVSEVAPGRLKKTRCLGRVLLAGWSSGDTVAERIAREGKARGYSKADLFKSGRKDL